MTDTPEYSETLAGDLETRIGWKWLLALGLVMIAGGVLAFFNPFVASLTVEAIVGATFLLAGAMELWMAFRNTADRTGERVMNGLLGVALVALAIALIANPLAGLVSLTLFAGLALMLFGGLRLALGFSMRERMGWGWLAASGAMSALLGVLVVVSLPGSAFGILGIFLAVDLVMSGITSVVLALKGRAGA